MIKTLIVFGTRPEAIKMAPLIKELNTEPQAFKSRVCVTAQHREMLDSVLNIFRIKPDYDLNLMSHGQTITDITTRVLKGMDKLLAKEEPDIVLVHGDTTTTLAASLAAFYKKIPVGHVEAGLRSGNIYSPYPEEMNRRIAGTIASLHFAPTSGNKKNLLQSGVDEKDIFVTGNTVIDALKMVVKEEYTFSEDLLNKLDYNAKKVILLTAHRRENWGEPMCNIFKAVRDIVAKYKEAVVVFPVHLNPIVKQLANEVLEGTDRIHLIQPLDYVPFANLMSRCHLVLTDSGGIQEEAPSLGKPVLVLRKETERPEAIHAGTVKMAGVEYDKIYGLTEQILSNSCEYNKMSQATNPYGDGKASWMIKNIIKDRFNTR